MKIKGGVFVWTFFVAAAVQANEGSGAVLFVGEIIDAPCSIMPESSDQTVQMGAIAVAALTDGRESAKRSFNIVLEGCNTATRRTVTATFTGVTDGELLALQGGTAKGAGIAIADSTGKKIALGKKSRVYQLVNGTNKLVFEAYLKGTGTLADPPTSGQFNSAANFTLIYE